MTLKQKERLAGRLEARRADLLRRFRLQRARASVALAEVGDPVDRALGEINRGTDQLLMELERRELRRLLVAQQRLRDGRLGVCRRCGGEIDPQRLAVRPESVLCVACASEIEQQGTLH